MLDLETIIEPEWLDWYHKTPLERLLLTGEAWDNYLELGGCLEPDADSQSPFWSSDELAAFARSSAQAPQRAFGTVIDD